MERWTPIRKVAAAAIYAALGAPLFVAWLMGNEGVSFRDALTAAVLAASPVVVAYFTPPARNKPEPDDL